MFPLGSILPKPVLGVGLRKISFDKNGRNGFAAYANRNTNGIRSRFRPGIGYAMTRGNF